MSEILLASASPRRAEILKTIGINFSVKSVNIDETPFGKENPNTYVKRISKAKNQKAREIYNFPVIITADTVVYKNGFLQKPKNEEEAFSMLKKLSGDCHYVYSAVTISTSKGEIKTEISKTKVIFHKLTDDEIKWYIKTGEPLDKAGAYGIQGKGSIFIKAIEGSYHNVVGFPVDLFYKITKKLNIKILK